MSRFTVTVELFEVKIRAPDLNEMKIETPSVMRRLLRHLDKILLVLGLFVVTFFLVRLIPGDPCTSMLGERATAEHPLLEGLLLLRGENVAGGVEEDHRLEPGQVGGVTDVRGDGVRASVALEGEVVGERVEASPPRAAEIVAGRCHGW